MQSIIHRLSVQTHKETELIDITAQVKNLIRESGVQSGIVIILSLHTTTGLTVNEGLPDLELDIEDFLYQAVSDSHNYFHARFLPSDGQMAVNATSHLRGMLLGFQTFFPIENGEMVSGARQTIYFVELDGPQYRNYIIQIIGI
jgi:secondary thiamine-phosphate synthase enzyme